MSDVARFAERSERAADSSPAGLDDGEFVRRIEPFRRELHAYCYRMSGSLFDADDLVQETMLRAWNARGRLNVAGHVRAWLYRVATNVCRDHIRRTRRRTLPPAYGPAAEGPAFTARSLHEPIWLDPYPDAELPDGTPGPDARYALRESVALAFLSAIQHLPGRQRAALILRDALGWSAHDTAGALGTSTAAVNSALQRARTTLRRHLPANDDGFAGDPPDARQRALLERYVRAWEEGDLDGLLALLREDAIISMPPETLWLRGHTAIRAFLGSTILSGEARGRVLLRPISANLQPAFALYRLESSGYRPMAITLLRIAGGKVAEMTGFLDPRLLPRFRVALLLPR